MENYQVPFGTPSVLAAFRLYRQMRAAGVTVVLNGEASDELFGGYTRRYAALLARDALRRGDLRQVMALLASPHLSGRDFMARLVWDLPGDLTRRLFRACQPSARAIAPDFWQAQAGLFRERQADLRQPLAGRLRQDVLTGALPAILSWADSGSMAWGVEVRSPFLDWRVVEAALSLPPSAKVTDRGGKRILREAFSGLLPDRVIAAPKTHGLGMAEQFTIGRMALDDLLEQPPAGTAEFLDLAALRHELTRHPGTMPLWWPICLLLWLRFLERQA
jgi:asparagine synthase (glutamine-hydrolysing)